MAGSERDNASIVVCVTCRGNASGDEPRAGALLADAVRRAAPAGLKVGQVRCLAGCTRGPCAAVLRPGAWSYVFGGLDPATAAPDLIEGARLLTGAADGIMPWQGRPAPLRKGLIARLPPLSLVEELS